MGAQQRVAGAAADDVHDVDRTAGHPLRVLDGPAVGEGRRVQDAARHLGPGPGRRLPRGPAGLRDARRQAETAPFFESPDGARPDEAMTPLTEVFHLP
ncbi:hypothetical protein ABT133_29990 [Streptomyces sp. NPDC001835]|uniref:hypothetical protein n=1 Tax=Streptomyces sp. NPDC001835 TaxID=3154528 RepID=UPI00332DBB7F